MSVAEMKEVLHGKIDHLSAEQLPLVKEFIEEIEARNITSKPSMEEIWKELMVEYDSTLRRLAQ
jgi:hypothetical protein